MQDIKEMWEKVLSRIENTISYVSYELWIEPLEVVDFKDKLILASNSQNAKRQVLKIHQKELKEAIESEDTETPVDDVITLLLEKVTNIAQRQLVQLQKIQVKDLILCLFMVVLVLERLTFCTQLETISTKQTQS